MRANLSSYDFNVAAVAAGMLGFVLGRKPFAESRFEAEGFIVDRGTAGPARAL